MNPLITFGPLHEPSERAAIQEEVVDPQGEDAQEDHQDHQKDHWTGHLKITIIEIEMISKETTKAAI